MRTNTQAIVIWTEYYLIVLLKIKIGGVDNDVDTNTIKKFNTLLKLEMSSQCHSISQRYPQKYVDKFCYRHRDNENAFQETINRGLKL